MADDSSAKSSGKIRFCNFLLNGEWYGQDIRYIHEVNRLRSITEMPGAPPYILGVINLRNQVIPVMDLRRRIGLPSAAFTKDSRVIVVEYEGSLLGILVDMVSQVLELPTSRITAPPASTVTGANRFISGIGQLDDRLVFFLDIERIFREEEAASHTIQGSIVNVTE